MAANIPPINSLAMSGSQQSPGDETDPNRNTNPNWMQFLGGGVDNSALLNQRYAGYVATAGAPMWTPNDPGGSPTPPALPGANPAARPTGTTPVINGRVPGSPNNGLYPTGLIPGVTGTPGPAPAPNSTLGNSLVTNQGRLNPYNNNPVGTNTQTPVINNPRLPNPGVNGPDTGSNPAARGFVPPNFDPATTRFPSLGGSPKPALPVDGGGGTPGTSTTKNFNKDGAATPDPLDYSNYNDAFNQAQAVQGPDNQNYRNESRISQQQWASMAPKQKYDMMIQMRGGISPDMPGFLEAPTALSQAFRQQFGNETWASNQSGRPELQGRMIYGYGDPNQYQQNINQWAIDPSRIMRNADGSWVMEASNIKGSWLANQQSRDDQSGLGDSTRFATIGLGTVLGGAALGNYFGLGADGASAIPGGAMGPPVPPAGGVTIPPPYEPIPPTTLNPMTGLPNIVAPGAATTGVFNGLANNPLVNNFATRAIGGSVLTQGINGLINNGSGPRVPTSSNNTTVPSPGQGTPTQGNTPDDTSGVPTWLQNILNGGIDGATNNRTIQQFSGMQNDLLNRADYNSQYRPGYLSQLNDLTTNPSGVINNDPAYLASRTSDLSDLSRNFAARGLTLSGNEAGGLTDRMKVDDEKYIKDRSDSLRASAGLGNPERGPQAALQTLPLFFQAINNRNAVNSNNARTALNTVLKTPAAQALGSFVQNLLSKNPNMSDDEIRQAITQASGGDNTYNENDVNDVMRDVRNANLADNGNPGAGDSDLNDIWSWFLNGGGG